MAIKSVKALHRFRLIGGLLCVAAVAATVLGAGPCLAAQDAAPAGTVEIPITISYPANWEKIEVKKSADNEYEFWLYYKNYPDEADIESDTKKIARLLIRELMAKNLNPHDLRTDIEVLAVKSERGETGQPMMRWFGTTRYVYRNDSLEYAPEN